jgi:hypothetical protein
VAEDRSGSSNEGSGEEDLRLRRAISDLTLDKLILQELRGDRRAKRS